MRCRLGLHKWTANPPPGRCGVFREHCTRCGKQRFGGFIVPIIEDTE